MAAASPPGYARPKSAGMGRSKSQGISKYANEELTDAAAQYLTQKVNQIPNSVLNGRQQQAAVTPSSFGPHLSSRPTLDQYTNPPNDRWSSSYRTQYGVGGNSNGSAGLHPNNQPSSARPYSSSSSNPQYYQRSGGGKEVVLEENISFQGINISNAQESNSYASGSLGGGTQSTGGGNTASSRIRAAINLGNQYNQQVKQRTQVVEDAVAVAKEREPHPSSAQQQTASGTGVASAGSGYAEMRPRMIKTIHNSTQPSATPLVTTLSSHKGNTTERTENEDGVDIDDHENGQLDDDDDDILGEERDGGVGTEGNHKQHVDSRSYGHTTNPEVSTPSLSIELGQQSSLSAHLHHLQNSIDIRNGSSSIEEMPSEYNFKLTTLPNQFCSMKEAMELQKIILSCRYDRTAPNGPAAAALMDMYMVGKIVGVGSYGKVRAAWHRLTSSKVAIKTYDKSKLKDPEHWKRVQVSPLPDFSHHLHLIE